MTCGLVTTLDGLTTSTIKLQTRQILPINYPVHTRLPYFDSENAMHRWTPTYIASRKNTKQRVCTRSRPDIGETVEHFLLVLHFPLYDNSSTRLLSAQPNVHATLYGSPTQLQRTATHNKATTHKPWTYVTRLSEGPRRVKKAKISMPTQIISSSVYTARPR